MFQHADSKDIDQIHSLLLQEAEQGHFEPRMLEDGRAKRMRKNLLSILRNQRRTDEKLHAEVLAWHEQGKVTGWLVSSEIVRGAGNELWMLLIKPGSRGSGAGGRMLDAAISALTDKVDIYARCYPRSQVMIGMFERRGFQLLDTDAAGNLTLKRLRAGSSESVSSENRQMLQAHVSIPSVRAATG